jgi:ribosome-binding factor A
MRSQRQLRIGEEIRHALAEVLMRGDVPWPAGFELPSITVTEVQVSPDLKNATAFVMPLGGVKLEDTVRVLNNHIGFFRHVIAQKVKLRYVPKLTFSPDRSFEYAKRINEILHDPEVAKDLGGHGDGDD